MNDERLQSGSHVAIRTMLRVLGPLTAMAGLVFLGVGLASFFAAFGSFQTPRLFWCAFVGIPLLFAGMVMCNFGYLGAIQRYMAAESAPVAKDVANYVAEGVEPGVKAVAKAVAEGIVEGTTPRPKP